MDELKTVFTLTKKNLYFLIACRKYHNQVNLTDTFKMYTLPGHSTKSCPYRLQNGRFELRYMSFVYFSYLPKANVPKYFTYHLFCTQSFF